MTKKQLDSIWYLLIAPIWILLNIDRKFEKSAAAGAGWGMLMGIFLLIMKQFQFQPIWFSVLGCYCLAMIPFLILQKKTVTEI